MIASGTPQVTIPRIVGLRAATIDVFNLTMQPGPALGNLREIPIATAKSNNLTDSRPRQSSAPSAIQKTPTRRAGAHCPG